MNATLKSIQNTKTNFWRIDHIQDTRIWDQDEMKAIPGTGEVVSCECCGRNIEVHAHIIQIDVQTKKISDRAIVGTQCCKRAKMTNYGQSPTNKDYWKRKYR